MTTKSIESFAYDWERTADPAIRPKFPFRIYLPRTVEDVETAVREARQFGQPLRIRGGGHSSNNLVLEEGGSVLWTGLLNKILDLDPEQNTIRVQAGASLAEVDEHLRSHGLGLPVIADNRAITAGGLASVGGVGPSSPRLGLFLDNVSAVEFVDWEGQRHSYARDHQPDKLHRILGSTGRHGVITTLTLDIAPMDKWKTLTKGRRFLTDKLENFIPHTLEAIENADDYVLQRGMWVEYPVLGKILSLGQYTTHTSTEPSLLKKLRQGIAFSVLHSFGTMAGKLPGPLGRTANFLGSAAFVFPPRYATIKNSETFTERVVDMEAGPPTRWLAVMMPLTQYRELFLKLHAICARYRDAHGCINLFTMYVVGLNSPWLAQGNGEKYCDILLHLGVEQDKMTPEKLGALVAEVDTTCVAHDAFRYQHSHTSSDPAIRRRVDASYRYE